MAIEDALSFGFNYIVWCIVAIIIIIVVVSAGVILYNGIVHGNWTGYERDNKR